MNAEAVINYGALVVAARTACGVSQRELAKRLGMEPSNLSRFEAGRNSPSLHTLERMAAALDMTLAKLLDTPIAFSRAVCRDKALAAEETDGLDVLPTRRGMGLEILTTSTRSGILARLREYLRLEKQLGIGSATLVQLVYPRDASVGGAEAAARFVRASCDAGTTTLADLSSLLEFRNVRIHFAALPAAVPSLSFFERTSGSFSIVLPHADTPERHTYRLAYELGVASLFASYGYKTLSNQERAHRFARIFAANFLMPAEAVRFAVMQTGLTADNWTLPALLALKTRFNVSAEAFALRLQALELISPSVRTRFRAQLHAYYKDHPESMEPEPCLKPLVRYARLETMAALAAGEG